jgi:hypothetical protein
VQAPPPTEPAPPPPVVVTPAGMPVIEVAEPRPAPNSIYIEGLGAGLAWSLNYERLVIDQLAVRVGWSYMSYSASASSGSSSSSSTSSVITFPITASYIGIRGGKHALELGGGVTLFHSSSSASAMGVSASGSGMTGLGTVMIGYRIHPVGHAGFQFRIGVMAFVGKGLNLSDPDPDKMGAIPWVYLSLGASF